MQEHKDFWDRNAGRYDRFMRKDGAAYEMMYEMIRPVVRHKTVLELATGTGLIAKHIVNAAALVEATDASAEMIAEAKRDNHSAKLHFSAQDMFRLPYANQSFDVVIVSNALHIVPQPEKALQEIKRVLKDDGVLIAPTFTHAGNSFSGKVKAFFMKLAGFPLHSRWTSEEYLRVLRADGGASVSDVLLQMQADLLRIPVDRPEMVETTALRAAALAFKLAEREIYREITSRTPLLLLDDVLSELDPRRQEYVLNRILGGQVFITCCEEDRLGTLLSGKVFHIADGKVV